MKETFLTCWTNVDEQYKSNYPTAINIITNESKKYPSTDLSSSRHPLNL